MKNIAVPCQLSLGAMKEDKPNRKCGPSYLTNWILLRLEYQEGFVRFDSQISNKYESGDVEQFSALN